MQKKIVDTELYYERCCGMDVHKKVIVVCYRNGNESTIRNFGTTSRELRELAGWLLEVKCEMVAMESTGSYWKPVYNLLEDFGLDAMVVNAQHMKNVPGRKTDVKDAEWMASLLSRGLLKPSFIPGREQRELREVTRYRKSLTEERAREINRLGKMLEGTNIKLSSYVSDIVGKSSRKLLDAALKGQDLSAETIESLIQGKLSGSSAVLADAMDGVMSRTQRKLIKAVLDHIDDMARRIKSLDDLIDGEMQHYAEAIDLLDSVDGIGIRSAQVILAEIGMDMSRFPSPGQLAAWVGVCPGNNKSAGKMKYGATRKGNATVKTTIVQCAQAAILKKGTFYRAQYDRLVVRRGANRAKMAVAHSMIIAIWHILKKHEPFKDLGGDYYNRFNTEKKINSLLKKLKELGWEQPIPAAV
jgi:transposase